MKFTALIVAIALGIILALGAVKVAGNIASENNPPVSCQLLGGHWNLFEGWQCGSTPTQTAPNSQPSSPTPTPQPNASQVQLGTQDPCNGPNASQIGDCVPGGGIDG